MTDTMDNNTPAAGISSNSSDFPKSIGANLRQVQEIPVQFQSVFSQFHHFNLLQSNVFDEVFYTDNHVVVSAPTGSGKTVVFELAIIRLLINLQFKGNDPSFRMIYVAPMKALCEERLVDWHGKFKDLGITCISVTGDSDYIDVKKLMYYNVILTTPEKWDSLTRRWKDNRRLVQTIKLFMIDEVHLLNEDGRGSTLEAVVSRMKIIQEFTGNSCRIRFAAVSATIPNVEDIAEWLNGGRNESVKYFKFSEDIRPVKLNKIVLGYPYNTSPGFSHFKFDIMLNYKLQGVLMKYAEGRPVLIFCSTRKSVEMTAKHITLNLTIQLTPEQQNVLREASVGVTDAQLRNFLTHGVGCHHAGMLPENRKAVETLFRKGDLPVLVTTSTLAMGVNLPAHLVIIKTTKCYTEGEYRDYSESAILQMTGRAGRPLFDTSAYAVIMTSTNDKEKFEKMIGGSHCVESNLHRNLSEHVNSEVVLHTITDLGIAMHWLTSTFLYVRARKNPRYYGLEVGLSLEEIDKKLLKMCQIQINKLARGGMLIVDETASITPTFLGELMARYYLAFDTMKLLTQINGTEILPRLLGIISKCGEFSDMYLRVNDKKTLNLLNACKNRETIRFPLNGKIKTVDMKMNCIIQAVFGNLQLVEHSLQNEAEKIMRSGERIVKCMVEYLSSQEYLQQHPQSYPALLSSVVLAKCFHARLWENSPYLSRQLPGIGMVMSRLLAGAGKNSFQSILDTNPRNLEIIVNRKPPLGNTIQDMVKRLPKYELVLNKGEFKEDKRLIKLTITMTNASVIEEKSTLDLNSFMILLVGDSLNNILVYERYSHSYMLLNQPVVKLFQGGDEQQYGINVHFLSDEWVGIDCEEKISFNLDSNPVTEASTSKVNNAVEKVSKPVLRKTQKTIKSVKPISKSVKSKAGAQTVKKGSHVQSFLDRYMKKTKSFGKGKSTVQKKKSSGSFENAKNKPSTSLSNLHVAGAASLDNTSLSTDKSSNLKAGCFGAKSDVGVPSNEEQKMNDSDEFLCNMMEENKDFTNPSTELSKDESDTSKLSSSELTDEIWEVYRNENNNAMDIDYNNQTDGKQMKLDCFTNNNKNVNLGRTLDDPGNGDCILKPATFQSSGSLDFGKRTENVSAQKKIPFENKTYNISNENKDGYFNTRTLKRKLSDENQNDIQNSTKSAIPPWLKNCKNSCASNSLSSMSRETNFPSEINNFYDKAPKIMPEENYITKNSSTKNLKTITSNHDQNVSSVFSNNYENTTYSNKFNTNTEHSYALMQRENNNTLTDSGIGSVQNYQTKADDTSERKWSQNLHKERSENIPMLQINTLVSQPKSQYYYNSGKRSNKMPMLKGNFGLKNGKEKLNISASLDKSIWFEDNLLNDEEYSSFHENSATHDAESNAYPDSTSQDMQNMTDRSAALGRKPRPNVETQKSISWRSPLVSSPAVKHSPKIKYSRQNNNFDKGEPRVSPMSRCSLPLKQHEYTPTRPSRSYEPIQYSQNGRTMLALSDRDHNMQGPECTITSQQAPYYNPIQPQQFHQPPSQSRDLNISDSLNDFCSDSLLDLLRNGRAERFDEDPEDLPMESSAFRSDIKVTTMEPTQCMLLDRKPAKKFTDANAAENPQQKNFSEFVSQFSKPDKTRRTMDTPSVTSESSRNTENVGYLNSSQRLEARSKWQKLCDRNEEDLHYRPTTPDDYYEDSPEKENVLSNSVHGRYDYENVLQELLPYSQPSYAHAPSQSFEKHWSNESVINAEHSAPRYRLPSTPMRNARVQPHRSYATQEYVDPYGVPPTFARNNYHRQPLADVGERNFLMHRFDRPDEIYGHPMDAPYVSGGPLPYFRQSARLVPQEVHYPRDQFYGASGPRRISDADREYMMMRFFEDVSEEDHMDYP